MISYAFDVSHSPQIESRHDKLIDIANEIKRNISTLEHSIKKLNEQLAQTSNSWLFTFLGFKAKKEERLIKQKEILQQQIDAYKIELTYTDCVWHLGAAIPIEDLEAFIRQEESQISFTASKNKTSIKAVDYYTYIQSPGWRTKAEEAKARANNRCQICNRSRSEVQLDAHHRTYERLGQELPDDITVLCRDCHELYENEKRLEKPTKKCKNCGRNFAPLKPSHLQCLDCFLSSKNRQTARPPAVTQPRATSSSPITTCKRCGKEFVQTKATYHYCYDCYKQYRLR